MDNVLSGTWTSELSITYEKRKSAMVQKHAFIELILGLMVISLSIKALGGETASKQVKRYTVRILETLPHNTDSFTQGLLYYQGMLYESTGLYGQSSLQQLDARTGSVQKTLAVPSVFAEGLARWQNRLIQLTWQHNTAFIYTISDFSPVGTFHYDTEGWGLTADRHHLIMSDGSNVLTFRDPFSFTVERTLHVTFQGEPVRRINELEYIDGLIYANIWYQDHIVQIDPGSGEIVGIVDATPLINMQPHLDAESVLNGIAYNPDTKTIYLTGKKWPKIFEVTLVHEF